MGGADVSVTVTPTEPLFDEELRIRVEGLTPEQRVTVSAEMAFRKTRWSGSATFDASAEGVVDLTESAPISGCYEGIRPMGLFQHMEPVESDQSGDRWKSDVQLKVKGDDSLAETTVTRYVKNPGVKVTEVDHPDLVGTWYLPASVRSAPPILLLGGRDPGIPDGNRAPLLASRGYPVLSLAYFGTGELPAELAEVPIEYFQTAGAWLLDQAAVRSDGLSVIGTGVGADLALFLGAHIRDITTVIAYNGSCVMFQGIGQGLTEPGAAFVLDGEDLPYVSCKIPNRFLLRIARCLLTNSDIELRQLYESGLERASAERIEAATIPVEKTEAQVLLITGEDDKIRPMPTLASMTERRLDSDTFGQEYRHLRYETAGHDIRSPFQPTTQRGPGGRFLPGINVDFGGTPQGYATAEAESWSVVLEYLDCGSESEGDFRPPSGGPRDPSKREQVS